MLRGGFFLLLFIIFKQIIKRWVILFYFFFGHDPKNDFVGVRTAKQTEMEHVASVDLYTLRVYIVRWAQ